MWFDSALTDCSGPNSSKYTVPCSLVAMAIGHCAVTIAWGFLFVVISILLIIISSILLEVAILYRMLKQNVGRDPIRQNYSPDSWPIADWREFFNPRQSPPGAQVDPNLLVGNLPQALRWFQLLNLPAVHTHSVFPPFCLCK